MMDTHKNDDQGLKVCPRCHAVHDFEAAHCTCGHDFKDGHSVLGAEVPGSSAAQPAPEHPGDPGERGSLGPLGELSAMLAGGLVALAFVGFLPGAAVGACIGHFGYDRLGSGALTGGLLFAGFIGLGMLYEYFEKKQIRGKAEEETERKAEANAKLQPIREELSHLARQLDDEIGSGFDERPCPRCAEVDVVVLDVSPNARSLEVRCQHCDREYRLKAVTDDTSRVREIYDRAAELRKKAQSHADEVGGTLEFQHQLTLTPSHRTKNRREPVPAHVRRAVWKRDGGECVECGAKEDLQYDHIIPVSKGGATSVENLEILCGPCNRQKSAKI